ncbi:c-type cytochrome [Phenylobacterium kunshanense]|uniref:Cytochrome c family protein n=1 Tax=Phenylobacterium kunshanense TaxID=1445034 RepID=A0A328BE01_9CAUL|nr:c-type cytochrome [Phenylobacterium kunshanense]RAK64969.1 cytochrome c family protein [Phenylobacterium kunshanense]
MFRSRPLIRAAAIGLGAVVALSTGAAAGAAARAGGPEAAKAEVEAGRKLFIRCAACHATRSEGSGFFAGPHLAGVVGRPAASVAGFAYSAELKALGITWTEAELDRLLTAPQSVVPGLCLPFTGFPKAADRKAMIAYLKFTAP